jgi:hypothetical protein
MGSPLAVRTGVATAGQLCSWSRGALDCPLELGAELWVHEVTTEGLALGSFERGAGVVHDRPLLQRGSGGPSVLLGPGTVHLALLLAHPGQLVACEPGKLVNRYVRPLLRALTRLGATAHYFGRDWVSVLHRPAAQVGFAHDAGSQRAVFEAFVAVDAPFALSARPSFLGKEPGTLATITGKSIAPARVVDGVVDAYVRAYGADRAAAETPLPPALEVDPLADPPWRATEEEVIGTIGAGVDAGGSLRLGGALLASRDAVREAAARASAIGPRAELLGRMVDEVFRAPGVALDGVRSLETVRDVLLRALET